MGALLNFSTAAELRDLFNVSNRSRSPIQNKTSPGNELADVGAGLPRDKTSTAIGSYRGIKPPGQKARQRRQGDKVSGSRI